LIELHSLPREQGERLVAARPIFYVALHVAPIRREWRGGIDNLGEFGATGATRKRIFEASFYRKYVSNFSYLTGGWGTRMFCYEHFKRWEASEIT
jgi:hypothetical protein